MNFYNSYAETIRQAIQKRKFSKSLTENFSGISGTQTNATEEKVQEALDDLLTPLESLRPLGTIMKTQVTGSARLGEHPDFVHLKGSGRSEYHYITSMFIDIKGSTTLHREYDLETIHVITNTIQKAAIHTCLLFGGHIQRLIGDGVLTYFGGKTIDKNVSVQMALNAACFFTYFVKNDLKKVFEGFGVEDIYTRIGIDFGDDDAVRWGNYGLGACSELTTLSLNTSLASKMQAFAVANGVMVGQNVKNRININSSFFSYAQGTDGSVHKYIYTDEKKGIYYSQYRFDWFEYLKSLPFIRANSTGELYLFTEEDAEKERIEKLKQTAAVIKTNQAYTEKSGNITSNSGVKNKDHRFHYEENNSPKKKNR